jgi:hypothetical protein
MKKLKANDDKDKYIAIEYSVVIKNRGEISPNQEVDISRMKKGYIFTAGRNKKEIEKEINNRTHIVLEDALNVEKQKTVFGYKRKT